MKALVTGRKGQLGYDVCKVLAQRGIEYIGTDIEEFDVTNASAVESFIKNYRPDAVIHCSAWTAVDAAEDTPEAVASVNTDGTRNIAAVCKEIGAKMLYISTDYVFSGCGNQFYEVNDDPAPSSVYGKTKLGGELAVKEILDAYFIVRTSWVYGKNGNNFVKTMLRLSETRTELNVVFDQIGSPTYTADLAPLLCDMIETEKYGTYHATNEGVCSWAEFAEEIFRQAGRNTKVHRIPSSDYLAKAKRPLNSRMSKNELDRAGFYRLPHWKNALLRYLDEVKGE